MYKMNVILRRFECLPSTNDYAKEQRALEQDMAVLADRQSGGKGTKGRSFSSELGGLYLTLLRFYQDLPANRAFTVMTTAAAAVCKTLEDIGLVPQIKWPNDVYVGGKKICGILIENTFSGNRVRCSIVGIGLNIYNELPQELQDIATSVFEQTGKRYEVDEFAQKLLGYLYDENTAKAYFSYLGWIGEPIMILQDDKRIFARLHSVDNQGNLVAQIDGEEHRFSAAEISLRINTDKVQTNENE